MPEAHRPQAPRGAQELDILMRCIDRGEQGFAALSDEQREGLKADLADEWISEFLDDYPVPADTAAAAREYYAIRDGVRFPNLPQRVREDLLIQFDQRHAEGGGPDHWAAPYRYGAN